MPEQPKNSMEFRSVLNNDDRLIFSDLIESAFSRMTDLSARKNFTNINLSAEKLWVLDIKGSLVGTLAADKIKEKDGIWLLSGLTVVPYWQKGGLATFMLKKAIKELKDAGCKVVLVFLHPELTAAEHLFLNKIGFKAQKNTKKESTTDSPSTNNQAPDKSKQPPEAYLASLKL